MEIEVEKDIRISEGVLHFIEKCSFFFFFLLGDFRFGFGGLSNISDLHLSIESDSVWKYRSSMITYFFLVLCILGGTYLKFHEIFGDHLKQANQTRKNRKGKNRIVRWDV